ncbi:piggyBac transposable element-derived protein 4-like [Polymixia lowei]
MLRRSSRKKIVLSRFRDRRDSSESEMSSGEGPLTAAEVCASRGRGRSLVRGQGRGAGGDVPRSRSPHGQQAWKTEAQPDNAVPQPPRFRPKRIPGVQPPLNTATSPGEIFLSFFDDEVLHLLCTNTNKSAAKNREKGKRFARRELTPEELKKYLGLLLYMAVCNFPKMTDFWRKNTIFHVAFPATVMSRDRFVAITTNLHISDPAEDAANDEKRGTEEYDALHRVRPLLDMLRNRCMSRYHPKQHVSVDERMVATKARLSVKQYMKAKPTKWRLKFFVLADVNGYTVDFRLYTGKSTLSSGKGLTFDVVSSLVNKEYLGSGYIVYCDNFYTSPALFQHLREQGFGACSTYRQGRVGVPSTQENALHKKSPRGSINNKYMGGVDTADQMLGRNSVHRKTRRWNMMVFQHFLDIAVTNSFILHKELCISRQQKHQTRQAFQEELVAQLIGVPLADSPEPPSEGHYPVSTCAGDMEKRQRASMGRKQCTVCKKSTPWKCQQCNVGLCLQLDRNCFLQYHQG